MRNWIFLLIVVIAGIVQLTLIDCFKVFGVKPDLFLLTMVIGSLLFKSKGQALGLAIVAAVLKDSFGVGAFGINTLLFSLWCFLILKLRKDISLDNSLIRIALIFIIAALHNVITGLILIYLGESIPPGIFLRIVFISSVYTALISPLLFKFIRPVYSQSVF